MKNNKKNRKKYQKKYTVTKQHVTKTPFGQWHMVVREQHINAETNGQVVEGHLTNGGKRTRE